MINCLKLMLVIKLIGMLNFLLGIIYHKFSNNTRKGIFIFFLLKKVILFVDIYYTEITSAHLVLRKRGSSVYLMCE